MGLKSKKFTKDSIDQTTTVQKPLKSKRKVKNVVSPADENQKQNIESLMSKSCRTSSNSQTKSNSLAQQKRSWKKLPRPSATSLDQFLKLSFKRHHNKKQKKKGTAGDNNKPLKESVALLPLREDEKPECHRLESKADPQDVLLQSETCHLESKHHRFGHQFSQLSTPLNVKADWSQSRSYKTLPSMTRQKQFEHTSDKYMSADDFNNNSSMFSENFNESPMFSIRRELIPPCESTGEQKCNEAHCFLCRDKPMAHSSANHTSSCVSSSKFSSCPYIPEEEKCERTFSFACEASSDKEPVSKSVSIDSLHVSCKSEMQAESCHDDSTSFFTKLSTAATEDGCDMVLLQNPTQSPYRQAYIQTDKSEEVVKRPDHIQTTSISRLRQGGKFQSMKGTQSDQNGSPQNIRVTKSNIFPKTNINKDVITTSSLMSGLSIDPFVHDTSSEEGDNQILNSERGIKRQAKVTSAISNTHDASIRNQSKCYKNFADIKLASELEELSPTEFCLNKDSSTEDDFKNQAYEKQFTDYFKDSESIPSFDERNCRHSPNTSTCSLPSVEFSTGLDTNSVPDINYRSRFKKLKTKSSSLKSPSHVSTNKGSTSWLKNRSFFLRVTESRRKQHKREWEKKRAAPICHRFSSHSQRECDLDAEDISNELQTAKSVITAQEAEIELLLQKVAEVQNNAQEEEYLRTEAEVNRVNAEHESRLLKVTIQELRELLTQKEALSAESKLSCSNLNLECLGDRSMPPCSTGERRHCYDCQTQSGDTVSKPFSREVCDQGYFSIPRQSGDIPFSPGQSSTVMTTPLTGLAQSTGCLFQHHKLEDVLRFRCGADAQMSYSNVVSITEVGCQTDITCKFETLHDYDKGEAESSSMDTQVHGNVAILEKGKKLHVISRLAVCFAQVLLTAILLENHDGQKFNIERMVIHHVIPSWKQIFK